MRLWTASADKLESGRGHRGCHVALCGRGLYEAGSGPYSPLTPPPNFRVGISWGGLAVNKKKREVEGA